MTGIRIFQAWVITVIAGSLLPALPAIATVGAFAFYTLIITLVLSALFSVPTLIALLIVNETSRSKSFQQRFRRVIITHILAYLVTMVAGYDLLHYGAGDNGWAYILVVTYFAAVATVVWIILFRKSWIQEKYRDRPVGRKNDPRLDF